MNSYNSVYPAEYFEKGTCYTFYMAHPDVAEKAPKDIVEKYSKILDKVSEEEKVEKGYLDYTLNSQRVIGIVADIIPADGEKAARLQVMFKTIAEPRYIIKYYVIKNKHSDGVLTDNAEWRAISASVDPDYTIEKGLATWNGKRIPSNGSATTKTTTTTKKVKKNEPEVGPAIVEEVGPAIVKEAGPAIVKEVGPAVTAESGPAIV